MHGYPSQLDELQIMFLAADRVAKYFHGLLNLKVGFWLA
jgi:hypothetical protein